MDFWEMEMEIKKMRFEHEGRSWIVKKAPSIYMSRNGKHDVTILKNGTWGSRENDGKLYNSQTKFSSEDGAVIFNYGAIPSFINIEWLKQNNFVEK